jgi:prepilin-type N-terminal cleavage/methylation domain-containing protein
MLKSQKGTSLIEILIAILLFGMGLSFAMRTLPESNVATTRGRNITKATNLAQEKIEELMSIPYSHADLAAGAHVDPENPINTHFTRSWNVTVDVPIPGMKRVNVTVSFETANPDSMATLATYITSRR